MFLFKELKSFKTAKISATYYFLLSEDPCFGAKALVVHVKIGESWRNKNGEYLDNSFLLKQKFFFRQYHKSNVADV